MKVVVVDSGLSNVGSVRRALEECGGKVVVCERPTTFDDVSHIVLPGVGAFAAGMAQMRASGWNVGLREAAARGIPILGICLGMQLLAERGEEGGETEGLGLISGAVVRMTPGAEERLPHVGWNDIELPRSSPLFELIPSGTDFYFVHSFHFVPRDKSVTVATAPYCGGIAAAVQSSHVFGVQFHPEKSSRAGFQLLKNFMAT